VQFHRRQHRRVAAVLRRAGDEPGRRPAADDPAAVAGADRLRDPQARFVDVVERAGGPQGPGLVGDRLEHEVTAVPGRRIRQWLGGGVVNAAEGRADVRRRTFEGGPHNW